jgi:hypothetical protein
MGWITVELYKEILAHVLEKTSIQVVFSNLEIDAEKIVEQECYKALKKIKAIIEDDSLDDPECFQKIEEIVCTFEDLGSGGSLRHDFG